MNDLAMHVMDLAYNSIKAEASLLKISFLEDTLKRKYTIIIYDNGKGMSKDILATVKSPFTTSRSTRKVGLGLSLFELTAMQAEGSLEVDSEENSFTKVTVIMDSHHVNTPPKGDFGEMIYLLSVAKETCNIVYEYCVDSDCFVYNLQEVREIVGDDLVTNIEVINWIKEYINENMENRRKLL